MLFHSPTSDSPACIMFHLVSSPLVLHNLMFHRQALRLIDPPVNSPPAFSGNANKMKSRSPEKNLTSQDPVGVKYKLNIEHKSAPEEGVESRFERVDLEKEKEASQMSSSSEIAPLLALLKACVDAFMKFWSE